MRSNPSNLAGLGIQPAIDASAVKARVIFAAPFKFSGFGWRVNAMLWAYLDTRDLENGRFRRNGPVRELKFAGIYNCPLGERQQAGRQAQLAYESRATISRLRNVTMRVARSNGFAKTFVYPSCEKRR